MTFKELIKSQQLSATDLAYIEHICKRWDRFSNTIGKMNKADTIKVLAFLVEHRPNSKTLGARAVQRFNSINRVRWEELIDD